ncbi:hypothetical protein DINM_001229 [Dirofilaria immitis]|nr:hypothetical protein [Dirofilaria immitis]
MKRTIYILWLSDNEHDCNSLQALLLGQEYDPNRGGFLALISYKSDNVKYYILAPQNIKPGDLVMSDDDVDIVTAPMDLNISKHAISAAPALGGAIRHREICRRSSSSSSSGSSSNSSS